MRERSYYFTTGLLGFREFLLEQQSLTAPGQSIDKQLGTVRNRIQLKKKQILLKQLDRALKIIDDKASNTSSDTLFIK